MLRLLALAALLSVTASAAGQSCPDGSTPLDVGVCLVVADGETSGAPWTSARQRPTDLDSTTVPYTVRLQELFAPDPNTGEESIRIRVIAEWTHVPGTPYYSMTRQFDGAVANGSSGAGRQRYEPSSSFPEAIVAPPGGLVYFAISVVGLRGGNDADTWQEIQANARANAETFRMSYYGTLSAVQPALTSEVQIAADSVSAGEPFDLDIVVTNPWAVRAIDIRPTGELTFTDGAGQSVGAVDVLEEPTPIDTLAGGASATLRYRVAVRAEGQVSATVPVGATWTRYYREPVEARPICAVDIGRRDGPSCSVIVSGVTLVVNDDGDEPDDDLSDDVCDASIAEPGLQCTLRAALAVAEKEGGANIRFEIPGNSIPRIALGSALEATVPVSIDGTSQPGRVEIDAAATGIAFALTLRGDGSTVQGIAFMRAGLLVRGSATTVDDNRFGASWGNGDAREDAPIPGTAISAVGPKAQIGRSPGGNEIVRADVGIVASGDSARVVSNQIGEGGVLQAVRIGIAVALAAGVTVDQNEVFSTEQQSVFVFGSAREATVTRNTIQFGAGDGIYIEGGASAVIGGDEDLGNRIQANAGRGLHVEKSGDGATSGESIEIIGNSTALNGQGGVRVFDVSGVRIGGPSERPGEGLGNDIADGVELLLAPRTALLGNRITDDRGTPSWPLFVDSDDVQVGGPDDDAGNRFDGSDSVTAARLSTILVDGDRVTVEGNDIRNGFTGLSLTGADAIVRGNTIEGHDAYGIVVAGTNAVVGGERDGPACESPCNTLTLNSAGGIRVGSRGTGTRILGNYVGMDGESAVGNGHGILIAAADVQIGAPSGALSGACDGACNVIGGNDGYGIVGGDLDPSGDFVDGSGPTGLVVQGNVIGARAGSTVGGNLVGGVLLGAGTSGAVIGAVVGEADGTRGNRILGNGVVGVRVSSSGGGSAYNTIRDNEIVAGNLPIDLVGVGFSGPESGSTPNDPGDADLGPNFMLNWPTLVQSRRLSDIQAELLVLWTGGASGTSGTYRLDVYANPACRGWMADASVRVAGATFTFPRADAALDTVRVRVPYSPSLPGYGAILTDPDGNTSEVGNCLAADSDGETQWVALTPSTPLQVLGLVATLRLATGRAANRQVDADRGGGRPVAVTRVAFDAASDTLFTGDVAGFDGGAPYQPSARIGPSWRLSTAAISASEALEVCLPAPDADPALVVWRNGSTTGLWRPTETVTQTIDGQDYLCATEPLPLGDVALARLGALATPGAHGPDAPSRLTLAAPFPNPARGTLTLRVGVETAGEVRVHLYDVRGRAVARVADRTVGAGWHEVPVDTGRLAPGVYVIQATAGGEVATRTLTVVR